MRTNKLECPYCGKILNNGKLETPKQEPNRKHWAHRKIEGINCTVCGSDHVCKDGRYFSNEGEDFQRYLCYHCGTRFSKLDM